MQLLHPDQKSIVATCNLWSREVFTVTQLKAMLDVIPFVRMDTCLLLDESDSVLREFQVSFGWTLLGSRY